MATICILLPSHWNALKGGAEYQADCLAKYITANTPHEVVYLARNVADEGTATQYRIERIPARGRSQKYGLFLDAPALYRALSRIAPDIILQHVGCAYTGIAAWYCGIHNRPLIWYVASDVDVRKVKQPLSLKTLPARIDSAFLHYGIKHAESVVAQTRSQKAELKQHYGREANYVIPNFHPPRQEYINKGSKLSVLWVGNLKRLKRPELFLKLAAACVGNANLRFGLIGRRESSSWCNEVLGQVGLTPNAEYLGELTNEEVNRRLAEAHILVNTSEYEGFPNTFIQAWFREVPVLSLNVDPDGVITGNRLGFHAGTMEQMRSWLLNMASNRDELSQLGVHARHFAEQHYSMQNAQSLVEVIESSLSSVSDRRVLNQC